MENDGLDTFANGLAKFPGKLRHLVLNSAWQQFLSFYFFCMHKRIGNVM
jgi:hypothetical protein